MLKKLNSREPEELEIPEPEFKALLEEREQTRLLKREDYLADREAVRRKSLDDRKRREGYLKREEELSQREDHRARQKDVREWMPEAQWLDKPAWYDGPDLIMPVPKYKYISSGYDLNRPHPVHKGVVRPHIAIDLSAPGGSPIHAAADGIVKRIAPLNGDAGNMIVLEHGPDKNGNTYETTYMHLAKTNFAKGLKVGQAVRQKDIIGLVGSTGASTADHLDFRISKNGKLIDPTNILGLKLTVSAQEQARLNKLKKGEDR